MALQFEVADLEGLDDGVKGFYQEHEGKYRLAVEGIDPADELKSALQKERNDHKSAKDRLKEFESAAAAAKSEAEEAKLEAAKKSGDYETLEKSWQTKLDKQREEMQAQLNGYKSTVEGLTVGQTATKLAADLAVQGSSDVLLPHIRQRLKTEYIDGQPKTVVLDKDGKPSAMSIDELKDEFRGNRAFSPLIVGSKASGAGHRGGEGGGATGKTITRSDFDQMNQMQRSAFLRDGGKLKNED